MTTTIYISSHRVNLLQYADDTCIVANGPASAQYLLDIVDRWLLWSRMKAKVSKCSSLAIQGSSGKLFDPHLTISKQNIPFANKPIKFLGMRVEVPHNTAESKSCLVSKLHDLLKRVDGCPVTRKQKLKLYRAAVCPRLTWLISIEEFSTSWINKNLEALATSFVKKWAGLARSANTAILYLQYLGSLGGLNLPSISTLHKRLQVSKQAQILTSADACVCHLAERELHQNLSLSRRKFKASVAVQEVTMMDPDFTRRSLTARAKGYVQAADDVDRLDNLQRLEKEGQMSRLSTPQVAEIWAKAVESLPDEIMTFSLNSAVDTLPHNVHSNLHLWKKKESSSCALCGEKQSLIHVLNACNVARDRRRYNVRHDSVLKEVVTTIQEFLPPTYELTADTGSYRFPQHIVPTDLRPDIVWWNNKDHVLCIAELTIAFETCFTAAAERKHIKYDSVVQRARDAGYSVTFLPLEVGSRGIVNPQSFVSLNSFAVMCIHIAHTCVGAHLLGITRVGDTPYCVWLIVFTSDCCVGTCAQMLVLDCRRGFEHLTGCKLRHSRYIRCRL